MTVMTSSRRCSSIPHARVMKELTLTGGTLLGDGAMSSSDVEMAQRREEANRQPGHVIGSSSRPTGAENSRSKGGIAAAGGPPPFVAPVAAAQVTAALDLVQQGDSTKILQALFGIVRMGPFPVFHQLVHTWIAQAGEADVSEQLKDARDGHGHSLLHWAAKRVDSIHFVESLLQYIPVTVTSSSEDTMMTPLHWACTESHALPIVRLLVSHDRYAVEVADSTGCTPLLIAAQHGQVETVAYLLHHGANLHAVDASRDSATHWAAYKGSRPVLGLLSFYDTRQLTTPDVYGQTPLHLAALRGHKSVCRYILSHVDDRQALQLLNQRDKNGRTPHALAVHKDKHSVASFLADYYEEKTRPKSQQYRRLLQRNLRNLVSPAAWKLWLGVMVDTSDVDESPLFPYYYVWAHLLINPLYQLVVFWSVGDASEGVLWDCVLLLVWQFVVYFACLYSFVQTSTMNPGRIDASFPHLNEWRQLYETTLEKYASSSEPIASLPQLCHTCHIARPLRSKHDRFTDACILVFDHHCPFVGNSIGLYNYKWFFYFLVTCSVFLLQHCVLLAMWWRRQSHPNLPALLVGVFLGVHVVFPAGMCVFHANLTGSNMTTNESMNMHKYSYLWESDERGHGRVDGAHSHGNHEHCGHGGSCDRGKRFRNPFNHGVLANVLERLLYPTERSYMLDGQMERLLSAGSQSRRNDVLNDPNAV